MGNLLICADNYDEFDAQILYHIERKHGVLGGKKPHTKNYDDRKRKSHRPNT